MEFHLPVCLKLWSEILKQVAICIYIFVVHNTRLLMLIHTQVVHRFTIKTRVQCKSQNVQVPTQTNDLRKMTRWLLSFVNNFKQVKVVLILLKWCILCRNQRLSGGIFSRALMKSSRYGYMSLIDF